MLSASTAPSKKLRNGTNMPKKILILGAGITGLSVARVLSKNGMDVTLIERGEKVGGIIKGFTVGNYTFDHGPHAILTRNKAAFEQFKMLIKKDLISIGERRAGVFFEGKHYPYPLKPTTIFKHSSPITIVKMLFSFIYYNARRVMFRPKDRSFQDHITNYFGKELYRRFFETYTKKVWEVNPSKLAASFAAERIPKLTFSKFLTDGIKKLFKKQKSTEFSENMMYYPKNGVGQIPRLLEREIRKNGGNILLKSEVTRLNRKDSTIASVEITQDGKRKTLSADYVVSTIPLPLLIQGMRPTPPAKIQEAARKLKYKKITFLFLVVNKEQVFDEHWVYFQDDSVFYRIFDTAAFSKTLMPKGKTGLIIELSTRKTKDRKKLYEETVKYLEKYNLVNRKDIADHYFDFVEHGYPIYSLDYKKNLSILFDEINGIENLITAGRQGLFRYLDMDHCIRMGPEALDIIANHKDKRILDSIVAQHGKKSF
jgi:protoporphyrinogen oxidase